ncbi:hypothetical protein C0J52_07179 [Blattella germanica]|nr:hypothetical protein C0J52_07179 [Blattella germanica]
MCYLLQQLFFSLYLMIAGMESVVGKAADISCHAVSVRKGCTPTIQANKEGASRAKFHEIQAGCCRNHRQSCAVVKRIVTDVGRRFPRVNS